VEIKKEIEYLKKSLEYLEIAQENIDKTREICPIAMLNYLIYPVDNVSFCNILKILIEKGEEKLKLEG
jgi:hypothetical protein